MIFNFGRRSNAAAMTETEPRFLTARINAPLQPLDRGEHFEDPLEVLLKADGLGEVTGGGTMLSEDGGIAFCDIEIEVTSDDDKTVSAVIAALEDVGAPKGSRLVVEGEAEDEACEIPFGRLEGMAIRLNAVDLPDETYEACDIDEVTAEIGQLLGASGKYCSYRSTETEYILYLYGPSFEAMKDALGDYMESCPLFDRCVVEQTV
ncbi:MAG: hypothetical protein AAGA69_12430 [Pseudomonadota bacterium]